MANLDAYWKQISESEKFQDLADDQKEKVRTHLFDQYIQKSASYQGLPQSQRITVKKHFDDMTKIAPETMVQSMERQGKKIVGEVAPIIKKGKEAVQYAQTVLPYAEEMVKKIEPYPMRKTYEALESTAKGLRKTTDEAGNLIEPNFEKTELSHFDQARMVASGAMRTVNELTAQAIPTDVLQMDTYPLMDKAFEIAGTTFLGKWVVPGTEGLHLPGWKPKTGLSSEATDMGDHLEKMITQRRLENILRNASGGPVRPLEVLAREEMKVKAQSEFKAYQDWLQQADKLSPSGGEPTGDLHPEIKTNVSQLRDEAKARLDRLQKEPIRIESISRAEDELRGFFRRKTDNAKVFMMPEASVPRGTIESLPPGQGPAGLLKPGQSPTVPPAPADLTPPMQPKPVAPKAIPTQNAAADAKTFISQAFSKRLPGKSKQAIEKLTGALMSSLKDQKMIPRTLNVDAMNLLDNIVESAVPHVEPAIDSLGQASRLRQKGLDPIEVKAEAMRLKANHDLDRQTKISRIQQFKDTVGGVGLQGQDPVTGKIAEHEEVLRNVPRHLRGNMPPDQAAQMAFDAGITKSPDINALFEHTRSLDAPGRARSEASFLDEAEFRLEGQKHRDIGIAKDPSQGSIPGTPPAEMPKAGLSQPPGQVPADSLLENFHNPDIKQRSLFDIVSDIGKNLGEKGGVGGEIDPVRQANIEANIQELVDRAMALGYETTQDIMLYAAKNAPAEIQNALRKNLSKTVSPFDSHAYKEMEAAKAGNPIAKKSLMDSAIRDYMIEKYEWAKGIRKRRSVSKIIGAFKDGDEAKMRLKNDLFIHDTFRKFNSNELAAMRWHLEGKAPSLDALTKSVGVPEAEAQEMLRLFREPSENMKKALPTVKATEDEWYDLMSEFYDSLGYRENHVTRRWAQPNEYMNWEGRDLSDRPNFMKGRKLLSQAEGIDAGYKPKSLDIRDDIKASNEVRTNLLSRMHSLRKIASTFDAQGRPSIMLEAEDGIGRRAQITPHSGKAPADWLRYKGIPLLRDFAINPDYKPAVDYIMGSRFKWLPIEQYEHLSALSKSSILFASGFHPYSLTEVLMGGVSYRDVFTFNMEKNVFAKVLRNFAKAATADLDQPLNFKNWGEASKSVNALYKSFMSGSAALSNRSLALDMAEQGFKFGAVDDIEYSLISRTMTKYENVLKRWAEDPRNKEIAHHFKEAEAMVKGVRSAADVFDKALWSYQRPLMSMALYENHLADNIRVFNLEAPEGKKIPIDQIKFSTANMISNMVGGISMGYLLVNPKFQQLLQWTMLAPDWTIGRILVPAAAAFDKGPEGRQARKSVLRMALGYGIVGNMMNYHNSQKYLGKGRFMWENDPGHELEIVWKKDPKDGRILYIQGSKVLTEIYDDIRHPQKTLAYKASPAITAAVQVMDWAKDQPFAKGPLPAAANLFIPRSAAGMNAYATFPVHKGVSRTQVMNLFDKFYETGNEKFMDEAMRYGMESGFDVTALEHAARARHQGQQRRSDREALLQ